MYDYAGKKLNNLEYDIVAENILSIINGMKSNLQKEIKEYNKSNYNKKQSNKIFKSLKKAINKITKKEETKEILDRKQQVLNELSEKIKEYQTLTKQDELFDKKIQALQKLSGIQSNPCETIRDKKIKIQDEINELFDEVIKLGIRSEKCIEFDKITMSNIKTTEHVYNKNQKQQDEIEIKQVIDVKDYFTTIKNPTVAPNNTGLEELLNIFFNSKNLEYIGKEIKYNDMPGFDVLFDNKLTQEEKTEKLRSFHTEEYDDIKLIIKPLLKKGIIGNLPEDQDFVKYKNKLEEIKQQLEKYIEETTTLADTNIQIESIKGLKKMLESVPDKDQYKITFLEEADKRLEQLNKLKQKQTEKMKNCNYNQKLVNKYEDIIEFLNMKITAKYTQEESKELNKKVIIDRAIEQGISSNDWKEIENGMSKEEFNNLLNELQHRIINDNEEPKKSGRKM